MPSWARSSLLDGVAFCPALCAIDGPARKRNVMSPKGVENDALLFLSRGQVWF